MADPSLVDMLIAAAEQDLRACEALVMVPGIGDPMVGFHAQQAVEKSLKAVLARAGVAFRRTHDIAELLDLMAFVRSVIPSPDRPVHGRRGEWPRTLHQAVAQQSKAYPATDAGRTCGGRMP